ncbi:MAG: hypothetical protein WBL19_03340 [Minisyncoccia bacterium]
MNEPNNSRVNVHASLILLTLGDSGRNPYGRFVIAEIRETVAHRYRALILRSVDDAREEMRSGAGMVPFYDTDCVGEPFFVRPKEHPVNPSWAVELSTGLCIGICREGIYPKANGVAIRTLIKATAQGIINWFGPNYAEFTKIPRLQPRVQEQYRHPHFMMRSQRR